MTKTERRRALIADLLHRNEVQTQEQLRALLEAEGIETTQSTLSRDLNEMGIFKRRNIYVVPMQGLDAAADRKELRRILKQTVREVDRGHNLVILSTDPGQEQLLMVKISESGLPDVLGAIAGHGAVWVATRTVTQAKSLASQISALRNQ